MKKAVLLNVLITVFITSIAQKPDIYNRPLQFERDRTFDVIHYRIELDVDMEKKSLRGENKITLSPLNNNFETVTLDAV